MIIPKWSNHSPLTCALYGYSSTIPSSGYCNIGFAETFRLGVASGFVDDVKCQIIFVFQVDSDCYHIRDYIHPRVARKYTSPTPLSPEMRG